MIHSQYLNGYRIPKRIIVHLIGFSTPVSYAAEEIQMFMNEHQFISQIIYNNKLSIINSYFKNDIIINKCNLLRCDDIKNLHHFINISSLASYNSYALLINSNNKYKYSDKLIDCEYINDSYDINKHEISKINIIQNLIKEI